MRNLQLLFPAILLALITPVSPVRAAEDCSDCNSKREQTFSKLEKDMQSVTSITEKSVCGSPEDLNLNQAKSEYQSLFNGKSPADSATLRNLPGVRVRGSDEEARLAALLISNFAPKSWTEKAHDCTTVICVLSKVYGSEESAYRVLSVAKRDGYFISASQELNIDGVEQIWSTREVRLIDQTLTDLPEQFKKLPTMKWFYRVADGFRDTHSPQTAAYAQSYSAGIGKIVIFDLTFLGNDEVLSKEYIAHELSHHLDFTEARKGTAWSEQPSFQALSGWHSEDKIIGKNETLTHERVNTHSPSSRFVRDYAGTDPAEDFAEAVGYFVYYPEKLKRVDPAKYTFIESSIFKGKNPPVREWPEYQNLKLTEVDRIQLLGECLDHSFSSETVSNPSCLEKKAAELLSKLSDACARGGLPNLERKLMKEIQPELDTLNDIILQSPKLEDRTRTCHDRKDFSHACQQAELTKAVLSQMQSDPLWTAENREKISKNLQDPASLEKLSIKLSEPFELLRQAGLPQLLFSCLSRLNPSEFQSGTSYFLISDECQKGISSSLEKRGFLFDSPTQLHDLVALMSLGSQGSDGFKSFTQDVINPIQKLCHDSACRGNMLDQLSERWLQLRGVKMNPELRNLQQEAVSHFRLGEFK